MTRPRRIDLPFCLYHVFSRTNSGDLAFLDSRDRVKFLEYVEKYVDIFQFFIHAFCLMDNHFHFLVESGKTSGLSEFMRRLLTAYTVYFNKRHHRHGHLFQGRFKSCVVDKANYLLELSRYIHLNPARSSKSSDPVKYRWSSFRHYVGRGGPTWLKKDEILSWFEWNRAKYEEFVMDGLEEFEDPEIIPGIYQQRFVGGEAFSRRMRSRLQLKNFQGPAHDSSPNENPYKKQADDLLQKVADYYQLSPESIQKGRYSRNQVAEARWKLIYLLRHHLPWTYREIAVYLNLKNAHSAYNGLKKVEKEKEEIQQIVQKTNQEGINRYK